MSEATPEERIVAALERMADASERTAVAVEKIAECVTDAGVVGPRIRTSNR